MGGALASRFCLPRAETLGGPHKVLYVGPGDKVKFIERLKEPDRMRCGICGCCIAKDRRLLNLARYKETKRIGCHHPGGSRWKKAGV